ncbi:hypothetical protein BDR26DRAFT_887201 [Obelidium mucronatum]|nr:hypothetical protein BDR26DRAFT_887201 [Obelidium mucronatum]
MHPRPLFLAITVAAAAGCQAASDFFEAMAALSLAGGSGSGSGKSGKAAMNKAPADQPPSSGAVYPGVGQGSVFGLGETTAVPWTNTNTNTNNSDTIAALSLVLGTGTGNLVSELYPLATVPYPGTTCYTFKPRSDLSPFQTYTIVFKGLDASGAIVSIDYVTWFKLVAVDSPNYPKATACPGDTAGPVTDSPLSTTRTTTTTPLTVISTSTLRTTTTATTTTSTTKILTTTDAKTNYNGFASEDEYIAWLMSDAEKATITLGLLFVLMLVL